MHQRIEARSGEVVGYNKDEGNGRSGLIINQLIRIDGQSNKRKKEIFEIFMFLKAQIAFG